MFQVITLNNYAHHPSHNTKREKSIHAVVLVSSSFPFAHRYQTKNKRKICPRNRESQVSKSLTDESPAVLGTHARIIQTPRSPSFLPLTDLKMGSK